MARPAALYLALDLAGMPTLAGVMQRGSLPIGVIDVIKIAARCPETSRRAVSLTGESPEAIRDAAILYLQSTLFYPNADCYRVLGVARDAPPEEIRLHMRWLMKWLHPDRQPNDWEATFAERVAGAWDELKSPDRRARYDRVAPRTVTSSIRSRSRRHWRQPWLPWIREPVPARNQWDSGVSRRYAIGIGIGLALAFMLLGAGWLAQA